MGTLLAVTVTSWRRDVQTWCAETAFATAARCERVMNRHDPEADLGCVNRMAGRKAVASPELAAILTICRRLSERTEGAFDPTAGAAAELWRRAARDGRPPSPAQRRAARKCCGWPLVSIQGASVSLTRPGAALDLDGLAKGLALDRIGALLERQAFVSALLNFGESSLLAVGRAPAGGWPVALRHPTGGLIGEFSLRHRACSTSATFGRVLRVGRRALGHILDPRSGEPVRTPAQATVLARSGAVAEAASTALLVMGRAAVARLAAHFDAEVCWIDPEGLLRTPGFELRATG
jgi:thiamine biosynthesis lipoprotein